MAENQKSGKMRLILLVWKKFGRFDKGLGAFTSKDIRDECHYIIRCTLAQQNGKLRLTKNSFAKALLKLQNKEKMLLEAE